MVGDKDGTLVVTAELYPQARALSAIERRENGGVLVEEARSFRKLIAAGTRSFGDHRHLYSTTEQSTVSHPIFKD